MEPDDEICKKVAADETERGKYTRKRNHLKILSLLRAICRPTTWGERKQIYAASFLNFLDTITTYGSLSLNDAIFFQ